MKQKIFTLKDKFTIKDENEEDKYYVEGKLLSIGKKLQIANRDGIEVAYIEQKIMSFLPRYFVYGKGEMIAEIRQKFSLFKPKFDIFGKNWVVEGNYLGLEYTIKNGEESVASIKKAWISWGDSYEISISDSYDEESVLAVVLGIDAAISPKK